VTKVALRMLRELRHTKGQMLGVVLIVAAAVAIHSGLHNSVVAVMGTREVMAARNHMADYQVYFWPISRDELPDLQGLPGVKVVEPRLVLNGTIALRDSPNPLQARAILRSVHDRPLLNQIEIVTGRDFDGGRDSESVIIDKALATYHHYRVGDSLVLTIGRATHTWTIVGIAVGPEHLVATANPEFLIPQKGSLGVVYLPQEHQTELLGADLINNVGLTLAPGTDHQRFEEAIKPLFKRVGVERYEWRDENYGYAFLKKDIDSLQLFVPPLVGIFVTICGFVAFAVFGQIIRTQRQEIGTMMALGVAKRRIVESYLSAGLFLGVAAGVLGLAMSFGVYAAFNADYQRGMGLSILLPLWSFWVMAQGFVLAVITAVVSTALPLLLLLRLQPIEAVRPVVDNRGRVTPGPLLRLLGRSAMTRFALRNITRDRRRFALTLLSIAGTIGVGLSYRTSSVSVDRTFQDYFDTDRWNVVAEYVEPQIATVRSRLGALFDVEKVEEYAKGNVIVRGPKGEKPVQVVGMQYPSLLKDHDAERGRSLSGADGEVFLYKHLADELGVAVGDSVDIRGSDDSHAMKVVGYAGFSPEQVYTTLADAQRLVKQEGKVAGALVRSRPGHEEAVARTIRAQSYVGNVYLKANIVRALKIHARELLGIITICIALAMMVACLVIATTTMVNILEREGDYAMASVLGFSHRSISLGILGETVSTGALGVLCAVPLSFAISTYLNGQVGRAYFYIETVQDPLSILFICAIALSFLPLAVRPGLKRIRQMNLAEVVRRKALG
jgi:putative ABC transport system permease protein